MAVKGGQEVSEDKEVLSCPPVLYPWEIKFRKL